MRTTISSYTQGRDNNFNLIRFIAASLVLLSHNYPLTANPVEPLGALTGFTFGHLAVDIFFITSGFLVTASLLKRTHLPSFILARCVRIYPGLVVAILFCVAVIGPLFTTLPITEYLQNPSTHTFFFYNSLLIIHPIQYALPGVFENLPLKNAVNGSLWTLPGEILMYGFLALLGLFLFAKKFIHPGKMIRIGVLLIAIGSTITYLADHSQHFLEGHYLPHIMRFTSMFFMGAALFSFGNKIPMNTAIFTVLMALMIYTSISPGALSFIVYSLAIPYVVLYLAFIPFGKIRNFNKLGDYSYGIYIYAFPVQQSVIFLQQDISPIPLFFIAFPITLLLAIGSWHFIEKPSLLRWKPARPKGK